MPKKGYKATEEHRKALSISHMGLKYPITEKIRAMNVLKLIQARKMVDNRGAKNVHWKGGLPNCLICFKQLTRRAYRYCAQHVERRGESSPRWIKDRTQLKKKNERNDMAYKEWSKNIKSRDGWKCRIFNQDCSGYLIAHHILSWSNFPELRYQLNNGITLCQAHHPMKRAEEKRLIPTFQELVSVSNN